jgi:hypothetical protein
MQWSNLDRLDAKIVQAEQEINLEMLHTWLARESVATYNATLADWMRHGGLANALYALYGPVGTDRRTLYETGGTAAVYEADHAAKLEELAQYEAREAAA